MIKASEIKEGGHYWIKYKNHKEVAYFEPSIKAFYLNGVRDAILPNDIFIIEKVSEPTTAKDTSNKATDLIPVVSKSVVDNMIEYCKNTYVADSKGLPAMLMGDVADLINIVTNKNITNDDLVE